MKKPGSFFPPVPELFFSCVAGIVFFVFALVAVPPANLNNQVPAIMESGGMVFVENAQGSLEYLLIIGGALAVGALLINLLFGIASISQEPLRGGADKAEVKNLELATGVDLSALRALYSFESFRNMQIVGPNVSQVEGKTGKGISFPGSASSYAIIDSKAADGLQDFTVMAWIKTGNPSTFLSGRAIVGGDSPSNNNQNEFVILLYPNAQPIPGYLAGQAATNISVYIKNSAIALSVYANLTPSYSNIADGKWHNIAFVRSGNGSFGKIYFDCRQVGSQFTVQSGALQINKGSLWLGQESDNPSNPPSSFNTLQAFAGTLDELLIIARPLSGDEIKKLARC